MALAGMRSPGQTALALAIALFLGVFLIVPVAELIDWLQELGEEQQLAEQRRACAAAMNGFIGMGDDL